MLGATRTPKSPFYRTLLSCLMACTASMPLSSISSSYPANFQELHEEKYPSPRPWLELLDIIRSTVPPAPTPRPTIDVDIAEMSEDRPRKEHPLISASFWCDTVVDSFRDLQLQRILRVKQCNYKEAKEIAEDPDPYDKEYLFYCLTAAPKLEMPQRYPY